MLKYKLKKYKLLYKGVLEIVPYIDGNNNRIYKLVEKQRHSKIIIININKFYKYINKRTNEDYEMWFETTDKYCDLKDEADRLKMTSPIYSETNIYCESDETLYDIMRNRIKLLLFNNKEEIFYNIRKTHEYYEAVKHLSYDVKSYIDEINEKYITNQYK